MTIRIYTRGQDSTIELVVDDDGNPVSDFEEFDLNQLVRCRHCGERYDSDFEDQKAPHIAKECLEGDVEAAYEAEAVSKAKADLVKEDE